MLQRGDASPEICCLSSRKRSASSAKCETSIRSLVDMYDDNHYACRLKSTPCLVGYFGDINPRSWVERELITVVFAFFVFVVAISCVEPVPWF